MKKLLIIALLCLSQTIFATGNVVSNIGIHSVSVWQKPGDTYVYAFAVTDNFIVGATTYNGIFFPLSTNTTLTDLAKSVLANLMSAHASGNKITFNELGEVLDINVFLPEMPANTYKLIRSGWLVNVSIP